MPLVNSVEGTSGFISETACGLKPGRDQTTATRYPTKDTEFNSLASKNHPLSLYQYTYIHRNQAVARTTLNDHAQHNQRYIMGSNARDTLCIFTPIGCVGYGYNTKLFWETIEYHDVDAIICDSGSTDSGPQKLALGHTTVPRESYEADLEPMVAAAHAYHIPVIISSAGGDGASDHVDM